jgi:hypothetical protein
VIQNIAAYIGYISTIGTFLIFLYKLWGKIKDIACGQKSLLRSDIMEIYYRHCDEDEPTLREYERKNLDALYEAYTALHGNSFITDIYNNEMRHWHVTK